MKLKLMAAGVLAASTALLLQACGGSAAADVPSMLAVNKADTMYFSDRGQKRLSEEEARAAIASGKAKNVILFVGDGLGISTLTAARIFDGQQQNKDGESNTLYMESLPYLALSRTYSVNQQTPDSAPTMTAMVTGVKTKEGFLSVTGAIKKNAGDGCADTRKLATIAEIAEAQGMATGIVSTARLTHATPAAVYSHIPNRDAETDRDLAGLVAANAVAAGCTDIASQLISFPVGDGLEVAMGGGRRAFLPKTMTDVEGSKGRREDGRDLTAEWLTKFPANMGGAVVNTKAQFDALNASTTNHVLGLFNSSHMDFEADRKNDDTVNGEPSLADMTAKAISILQKNQKGFFLMVEAGRIDHAHHAGNAFRALKDTQAFDAAIKKADEMTNDSDTLIVVTADHSHTLTIGGYPFRNNPILGLTREANNATGDVDTSDAVDLLGKPYTTLLYANGLGFAEGVAGENIYGTKTSKTDMTPGSLSNPRANLVDVDTQDMNYHQEALVPTSAETHAGEDVMILAKGPGAHLFRGVVEQSYIFHVMTNAQPLLSSMVK
ncbi:MAG: alkaline phosphatase [Paraperlucidibaca sp.]